jgi:RNA polymerase sigma-70 factor, ECF subfamily
MQAAEQVPDGVLVERCRAGEKQAFADLIQRHQRMLLIVCERSLGDRAVAEDAAQEAVLHALLGLDHLRRPAQFGAWLAGIGLNICRRWLRTRPGASLSLESLLGGQRVDDPVDALTPDPAWLAEERDLALRIRSAVNVLPSGQRQAVVLFHLMGMTHVETAAALGIPVGAVKTRLHKARSSLRRELWTLWKDMQPMSTTAPPPNAKSDYVDVQVVDVRRIVPNEQYSLARNVTLLQETNEQQRILGIWIGSLEGEAILILLSGVKVPRPLTFNFSISLLEAAGGQLREVRVNKLVDKTFFAEAVIARPDGTVRLVDARPSDAIALALTRSAPIRVAEEVMREAAWATTAAADADVAVDGNRVLGRADIVRLMEEQRVQRESEMQKMGAETKRRRAAGESPQGPER